MIGRENYHCWRFYTLRIERFIVRQDVSWMSLYVLFFPKSHYCVNILLFRIFVFMIKRPGVRVEILHLKGKIWVSKMEKFSCKYIHLA